MNIPYRMRRFLRGLCYAGLILVLVAAVAWLVWLVWLERYVVYSDEGAKLDFSLSWNNVQGELAVPPEPLETVSIYYNEGENAINTSTELVQLMGFYADGEALSSDLSEIRRQVETFPTGTPVMLDMKSSWGYFYYTSRLGQTSSDVSPSAVEDLIQYLKERDMYLIARIPAFRDRAYLIEHTEVGLPVSSGAYLWSDDDGCYYFDPSKSGTITYLMQIVSELKNLGFDEVVFSEFRFPDTDDVIFDGERNQALAEAAANLVSSCSTTTFAVSFVTTPGVFTLPQGRARLYLENVAAADVAAQAQLSGVADTAVNLVFITETNDTRYNDYGVLRPISAADAALDQQQQQQEEEGD